MDISPDPEKKKKGPEPTSERLSRGSIAQNENEYIANGEKITMAPDLKDLPEFDWADPKAQAWSATYDKRWEEKFKGMTIEDLDVFVETRATILAENPGMGMDEAGERALSSSRKISL